MPDNLKELADLGCGLGCISFYLADRHPEIFIHAVDLQEHRIELCQRIQKTFGSFEIDFKVMNVVMEIPVAKNYVINDVLLYLSELEQLELINRIISHQPDLIYIKTHDSKRIIKYFFLRCEEYMGRILRSLLETETDSRYFKSGSLTLIHSRIARFLSDNGYQVDIKNTSVGSFLPHLVMIARRNKG